MLSSSLLLAIVALIGSATQCLAFVSLSSPTNRPHHRSRLHEATASSTTTTKTTLTDETTWLVRMSLGSLRTTQGKRIDNELVSMRIKFIEEEGYEPPQGRLDMVTAADSQNDSRWRLAKSYWKLSEDPNERKDGLWIWGLFKEPLYPFLLLQMETCEIALPSSPTNIEGGNESGSTDNSNTAADTIAPMQLYAQINHKRDAQAGVILEGSYPLKIRRLETIKADPFGAATVDIYEDLQIGTIRVEPLPTQR